MRRGAVSTATLCPSLGATTGGMAELPMSVAHPSSPRTDSLPQSLAGEPSDADVRRAVDVGLQALRHGARALDALGAEASPGFVAVLQALRHCRGQVVITGVGKSGHIGRKAAATFASVGVRSTFMHATEAVHGDLGQLGRNDVVLALSWSGTSREVLHLIAPLRALGVPLLVLTGAPQAPLAQAAQAACVVGPVPEACALNLVPTTSTLLMLAILDAWALGLFNLLGQSAHEYGKRHPAGALGQAVKTVAQVMRQGARNPIAQADLPISAVLEVMSSTPGRPGAATLVDADGKLVGVFTDGDLRRRLMLGPLDVRASVGTLMHRSPKTVRPSDLVGVAMAALQKHAIDQLPVVDDAHRPVGLVDVHDVLPGA